VNSTLADFLESQAWFAKPSHRVKAAGSAVHSPDSLCTSSVPISSDVSIASPSRKSARLNSHATFGDQPTPGSAISFAEHR